MAGVVKKRVKRVGVLGTFIWDIIHGRPGQPAHGNTVEEWGGITYSLAGFDAALGNDWEMVLLTKSGQDMAVKTREFTNSLTKLAPNTGPILVPDPTTRVTIVYKTAERRNEYLTGGITSWSWLGLKPLLADLDALYINLISGFELDLETAQLIRQNFKGPIYCDLHSLLLMRHPDGLRTYQPLPNVAGWCGCFDIMQVNEDEMHMMAPDGMALAATAIANGVSNLIVTVGSRGAIHFAAPGFEKLEDLPAKDPMPRAAALGGPIRTELMPVRPAQSLSDLDPTGCGDVFGSTYFAKLLSGDNFAEAMQAALSAASRNVNHRGATGLGHYLRGSISIK